MKMSAVSKSCAPAGQNTPVAGHGAHVVALALYIPLGQLASDVILRTIDVRAGPPFEFHDKTYTNLPVRSIVAPIGL